MVPDGPNQLWVADITYVAITTGFVYVAVILDAWSRKVVGYAIGRSIDVRLTLEAQSAIEKRKPPQAVSITDRFAIRNRAISPSARAASASSARWGRSNPYDNAKAEKLHEDVEGCGGLPNFLRLRGCNRPFRFIDQVCNEPGYTRRWDI
jgi:putative transposase